MKRTRRLSFLVAMIIAITNIAAISIPSVGAEGSDFIVSDDFESYTTVLTEAEAATLPSMQELCDMNPWWYSVKANSSGTVFNKAEDVKDGTPLIASVVNINDNNMMRVTYHSTAGVGTNIVNPSQANMYVYENNSYEVSFKFCAAKDMQILGVGGKQENGTATFYHHNILTKAGDATYMGDTEASSPAGQIGAGVTSNTWYTLKLNVNNGLGYYSVEILDENGVSLQRVGGINFKDGCPAISNIRFHAPTASSVVYIDDYTVKKISRDNLLFEDDFNNYTTMSGTTTAGANLFREVSQFRVLDTSSVFGLGGSEDKYFVLNKNGSAVYMPWNGYLLTTDSQGMRGKLQLKFSYYLDATTSPKGTDAAFKVICADKFNASNIADLANDAYTMFRVRTFAVNNKPVYGMQKAEGDTTADYQQINKGTWYDVQLTFDLINDKVSMVARESGTTAAIEFERSTSLYNGGTPLKAIKSIMFKANDGIVAGIDNVELKYIPEALQLGTVKVKDFNGASVTSFENVNPALSSIEIPFSSSVTDDSVKNIKLISEDSKIFTGYTTTNVNGVYTMSFGKTLAPNTKYQLSIPTTVESIAGTNLAAQKTYQFTTGSGNGAEMAITDVNFKTVEEITNGSTIQITTKYANTTEEDAGCLMIVAYYDANNALIGSSYVSGTIPAGSVKTSFVAGVNVPGAEQLDLTKVKKVSVFLWDNYANIKPYCESVDIY